MSCEYCGNGDAIFKIGVISRASWGWGGDTKITIDQADEHKNVIFIDRGYMRSVAKDDCDCMDHGEKVKINYCPFCGDTL